MAKSIVFHPLARQEVKEAARWYAQRSPTAANNFKVSLEEAVRRSAESDHLLPRFGTYRFLKLRKFPYLLFLQEKSDVLLMVVAVAHVRRRLGYWKRRK
jgi:plasmid stabilization system protein ParE